LYDYVAVTGNCKDDFEGRQACKIFRNLSCEHLVHKYQQEQLAAGRTAEKKLGASEASVGYSLMWFVHTATCSTLNPQTLSFVCCVWICTSVTAAVDVDVFQMVKKVRSRQ